MPAMMAKTPEETVREFLRRAGSKGGKARAKKYSGSVLRKWARLGGRPPKKKKGGKR